MYAFDMSVQTDNGVETISTVRTARYKTISIYSLEFSKLYIAKYAAYTY